MSEADLVIVLRDLRMRKGLTQVEVARRSGLGPKSISAFETGSRIDSLKLRDLRKLLAVYCDSREERLRYLRMAQGIVEDERQQGRLTELAERIEVIASKDPEAADRLVQTFMLMAQRSLKEQQTTDQKCRQCRSEVTEPGWVLCDLCMSMVDWDG